MKKTKCLAITHPDLCKQWHPTKNFPLTPFDVTKGSGKKVWWICPVADDHEWISTVIGRTQGRGCPCCSNHKIVSSNCLAITHPNLSKEWHPTKNLSLTPFDVVSGTSKRIWWRCDKADDHEWQAKVAQRAQGFGCPFCSGHKVTLSNSIAIANIEMLKQWHPTKNLHITPFNVTDCSSKKVWWKCSVADDHEWECNISKKSGCPFCGGNRAVLSNCLATTHPEIAKQWHPTKNLPRTPFDVTHGSAKKVWWKCDKALDHEWIASVGTRTSGNVCPYCPYCNESNGEKEVKQVLNTINIIYIAQKKFNECKNKRKLSFDFYLPQYNALIEYDGRQHFEVNIFFGGIESFKATQRNDEIKNKFALENNIPLLRIPYTKFSHIEKEIKTFISNISPIQTQTS